MRRWTIRIIAVVGLAIACATAAMWVRSYRMRDYILLVDRVSTGDQSFDNDSIGVLTVNGFVHFYYDVGSYFRQGAYRASYRGFEHYSDPTGPEGRCSFHDPSSWWSGRGFDIGKGRHSNAYADFVYGGVSLPAWFVVLVTSLPAVVLTGRSIAGRRRSRVGLCSVCGYDLRATPDRCPECGAVPAKP